MKKFLCIALLLLIGCTVNFAFANGGTIAYKEIEYIYDTTGKFIKRVESISYYGEGPVTQLTESYDCVIVDKDDNDRRISSLMYYNAAYHIDSQGNVIRPPYFQWWRDWFEFMRWWNEHVNPNN